LITWRACGIAIAELAIVIADLKETHSAAGERNAEIGGSYDALIVHPAMTHCPQICRDNDVST
jgi:hypothetical protein